MSRLFTGCEADVAAVESDLAEFRKELDAMSPEERQAQKKARDDEFLAKLEALGEKPFW